MSENGYLDSFVASNRGSKNDYRDSGFNDDDSYNKENTHGNKHKINSFNISTSTDRCNDNEDESSSCFNSTEFICIVNILASTLGGGAFLFPYLIYQVGIITSLIILAFVSLTVYYSLDLLRRFVVDSKLFSFSIITQTTLGNLWLKIYAIAAFLFYMSCIVNYLDLLYQFSTNIFDNLIQDGLGKFFYFLISCLIEVVLCIFTSKISKLYFLSLIVIIIYFIITLTIIINSIIALIKGDYQSFSLFTIEDKKLKNTSWNAFLIIMKKIIEIFYGFIYHSTFPTLLNGLNNISDKSSKKIQNISYIFLNVIYIIFIFFGFSFCNENSDLIFTKENFSNSFLNILFQIILVILFITLIPIRYLVIRDNYTSLIGKEELPLKYEILITSFCLIIDNLIVYLTGDSQNFITELISYFGGALGVFIAFVLPVISYMAINGKTKIRSIFGYIIVAIFIVIGFFSIFYNFQSRE